MEIAIVPKFILTHITRESDKQYDYNVLITNFLLLLLGVAWGNGWLPDFQSIPHSCLTSDLIGVHCPGCGITTASREVLQGNFLKGAAINMASPLLIFFISMQIPLRLLNIISKNFKESTKNLTKWFQIKLLFFMLFNWIINL